ncbi:NADP-dependent oxidoreductase [Lewinella sp. IMCC34183]|uniref:NADP-dependent oxidoreductase n=1 Tax=Lewinella sp. IMCC34183 TaxID=2248762 RepID=UPI000E22DB71|nr:NADP-dependent oxidoreductase [Lewinella sp. IMCC34183]
MKAYTLPTPSGPEGLLLRDIARPTVTPGSLIIRVHAISLNPVDVKTSHGKAMYDKLRHDDPLILGWDVAGEVVETGSNVEGFAVGDRVFGMIDFPGHGQAYAEYVRADGHHLAHIPENIGYEAAAATTLAALTAWQNLIHLAKIKEGQRVLIHAAGGGVGHFAVQLAKERGAYVIATSSGSKRDFVLGLGADEHIDYNEHKFEEAIEPVDVVLDSLGPDHLLRSLRVVKSGGHLFTIAAGISDSLKAQANERNVLVTHHLVQSNGEEMISLAARLSDGRLKAHVSQTYPFDQLPHALTDLEAGGTQGKRIVVV